MAGWLGEPPAKTIGERLLALCPVYLMDAACELDVRYASMKGHALQLIRHGKARYFRNRLVSLN